MMRPGHPSPRRLLVVVLAAYACACASAPRPTPGLAPRPPLAAPDGAAAGSPMPLPRSSIAAVILRREELALSEEQVQRLEQVQVELDQKDGTLRQGAGVAADPAGAERDHQNDGRRLGGRTGGAGGGRSHGAKAPRAPSASEVERALDDADTAAFLDAEKVLREDQQERARAIAEKFREDLYDAREQARRAGAQAPRS